MPHGVTGLLWLKPCAVPENVAHIWLYIVVHISWLQIFGDCKAIICILTELAVMRQAYFCCNYLNLLAKNGVCIGKSWHIWSCFITQISHCEATMRNRAIVKCYHWNAIFVFQRAQLKNLTHNVSRMRSRCRYSSLNITKYHDLHLIIWAGSTERRSTLFSVSDRLMCDMQMNQLF